MSETLTKLKHLERARQVKHVINTLGGIESRLAYANFLPNAFQARVLHDMNEAIADLNVIESELVELSL